MFGAEAVVLNLMTAQRELDSEVALAVLLNAYNPHEELADLSRSAGVPVDVLRCGHQMDASTILSLGRIVRRRDVDVVHSHGYKADIYTRLAKAGIRARIDATCHNWTDQTRALRAYGWIDRRVLRSFDAVGAVSRDVAARLARAGLSHHKVEVIPNGVRVPVSPNCETSEPVDPHAAGITIGMVGRLVREKGFQYVVTAAKKVLSVYPQVQFVIAGEGPDRDELTEAIRALGLQNSFRLLGFVSDMEGFYRASDIVILPSLLEGMPMSVLEAMAHARPVIATRVGAIPEVIEDGRTGVLVEPRDVQGLTESILYLAGDSALRGAIGRRSQQRVLEHFSSRAMASRYLRLYTRVFEAAPRGTVATSEGRP